MVVGYLKKIKGAGQNHINSNFGINLVKPCIFRFPHVCELILFMKICYRS